MTITLSPRQEQVLEAALKAGAIKSVEAFVESAIARLPEPANEAASDRPMNLVEICAMVKGLTDDVDFSRNPSTGRPVDVS